MIIKASLILIIVFSPLFRGSVNPMAYGILQAVVLCAVFAWFTRMFSEGSIKLRRTDIDTPLIIFIILAVISTFRSPYTHDSLMELFKLLSLALVFYLVVNNIRGREDILSVSNVIVIMGAGLSLFGIIQYAGGLSNSWWSNRYFLSSVYVNHNHFAGLLELCLPLCVGLALTEKAVAKKLFYVYLIIIMFVAFVLSMSRGGWFSLTIAMAVMFALLSKKGFIRFGIIAVILLLVAIGFFIVKNIGIGPVANRIASYRELDFSGRLYIWKGGLRLLRERPFLGSGLGTFIYFFPRYRPVGFNLFANAAHNDYLQVAVELGILGLLCMIWIFYMMMRKAMATYLTSHSSFKKALSVGLFTGILSLSIHSLADFNLRIPANATLFSVLAGIVFSLRSGRERPEAYLEIALSRNRLRLLRPVFNVAILAWVLFIARFVAAEAVLMDAPAADMKCRIASLQKAVIILPGNNTYYKKLGQVYTSKSSVELYKEKNLLMALENYKIASDINPIDAWARIGVGDSYLYLGRLEEARRAYEQAVELDPNNSYYLKKLGSVLAMMEETGEAVATLKRASFIEENRVSKVTVSQETTNPAYYIKKGNLYYSQGRLDEALNMFKIARELAPEASGLDIKIQSILGRLGEKNVSAGTADSERKRAPLFLNSKARYLMSKGQYDEADRVIEKAFSIDENDCVTLQNKIDLLQKERRPFEVVRPYLLKLMRLNQEAADSYMSGKNIVLVYDLGGKGNMAKSGKMILDFNLPFGLINMRFFASGTSAKDEWPHMLVRMNLTTVLSEYVTSVSLSEFRSYGFSQEGPNSLTFEFSNDYWDSVSGEDRNLKIDRIILEYVYPDYES
ncbi:MAG: O-antigen ligase family protein [Candidatus Omnitrophica bacterium]|nr:O-antigen ligase family protein [Candidatus Omnitrophota bacterium]MBU1932809.1 O-antigen ligase family protein [Candidatus Omnitrophota bacterium]